MLAAWRVDPKHDGFKHNVHFNCGGLNFCMQPLLAELGGATLAKYHRNTVSGFLFLQEQGAYPRSLNHISVGEAMRIRNKKLIHGK